MSRTMNRTPPLRRFGRTARGYTAVEVLLSLGVLAIGAMGVMSMQRGVIVGDTEARKLDVANSIARDWLERIRRDATLWTLPSGPNLPSNEILAPIIQAHEASPLGTWFLPPIPGGYPADGQSPAFDILGRDLDAADAPNAVFCVHVRIDTLSLDAQSAGTDLVRATVLVYWPRQLQWSQPPSTTCDQSNGFDVAAYEANPANTGTFHLLYASTVIRKNPLP